MWPSASNARLAPRAQEEGLTHVGAAPLMLLRSPGVSPAPRGFAVERVTDAAQLGAAADLIASAFGLDRGWVGRTFAAPSLLDAPTVRLLLATRNGEPYSTLTSTNASAPGLVGIWSMATAPDRQHQGGGRAILEAAIAQHRAEACYLVATESGKPLYDAVGFETIDELAIWVAGHSEQFH
jgi:GNAT superfamily N-acetyltransferase